MTSPLLFVLLAVSLALARGDTLCTVSLDDGVDGSFHVQMGVADPSRGVAAARFRAAVDDGSETGWARLEVEGAADGVGLPELARGAGIAEGVVSAVAIDELGTNLFSDWGLDPMNLPPRLEEYMTASLAWARKQGKGPSSWDRPLPHGVSDADLDQALRSEVGLLMEQFRGLVEGYQWAAERHRPECLLGCDGSGVRLPPRDGWSEVHLYMMNSAGDMETLLGLLRDSKIGDWHVRYERLDCSAVVRLLDDDIVVAHATWRGFSLMNRVFKTTNILGQRTAYSSSPGYLSSKDDYYLTGYGLAIYETTNSVFNRSLFTNDTIKPETLLSWVRAVVSNRLAADSETWTRVFAKYNSGTYNNQWGVTDLKLQPDAKSGLLWIIEQLPGRTKSGDVTSVLRRDGYFPSYNIPYFQDVYDEMGYPDQVAKSGNGFSYHKCPRALIFGQLAPTTRGMADVQRVIRFNEWKSDPLSQGDPSKSIASRYDLRPDASKAAAFGAIDAKVTARSVADNMTTLAIAGPTHQSSSTPPFVWSESAWMSSPHFGQPDGWDFDWVQVSMP